MAQTNQKKHRSKRPVAPLLTGHDSFPKEAFYVNHVVGVDIISDTLVDVTEDTFEDWIAKHFYKVEDFLSKYDLDFDDVVDITSVADGHARIYISDGQAELLCFKPYRGFVLQAGMGIILDKEMLNLIYPGIEPEMHTLEVQRAVMDEITNQIMYSISAYKLPSDDDILTLKI